MEMCIHSPTLWPATPNLHRLGIAHVLLSGATTLKYLYSQHFFEV